MRYWLAIFCCGLLLAGTAQATSKPAPNQTAPKKIRNCQIADVLGIWKLDFIQEHPSASGWENYKRTPYQYMYFGTDTRYGDIKSRTPITAADLNDQFMQQAMGTLRQYVLAKDNTGRKLLYLYTGGIATDALYCSYVLQDKGRHKRGDLLLSLISRNYYLIMVYRRPNLG